METVSSDEKGSVEVVKADDVGSKNAKPSKIRVHKLQRFLSMADSMQHKIILKKH
jgi:hypothetical protein